MKKAASTQRPAAEHAGDWLLELDPGPIEVFLTRTLPGFRNPISIHPARPSSRSTFIVSTPDSRFALRRAPTAPDAAGLEQEFRMVAALRQRGFPVPRPHIYCDNEKLLGAAFYVMDYIEGRTYQDPTMPGATPAWRAKAYDALNFVLAQLHSFDPRALGIGVIGNGRNYVAEQVERCTLRYLATRSEEIPEMERLIAWLPKNLPPDRPPRVIHGNFGIENVVFHASEPQVVGILNWRLSGLGDPLADAVYHFMAWILLGASSGLSEAELVDQGIPTLESYAASYAVRNGMKTIPHFETYFAYNLFRMAVLQGLAPKSGSKPGVRTVRPLAALAWAFARRAGA